MRSREVRLKAKYGITGCEYDNAFAAQDGRCAICGGAPHKYMTSKGEVERLHVDHCHKTGVFRGLLCGQCNRAIGLFKDDVNVVAAALRYLQLSP